MAARGWSPADRLALLALLALNLAAYGRLLDPTRMLADYDAFVYFYPLRAYAATAFQEGRLPLWNPSSFLGVPFIANPQTAVFYPLTAIFFWLPVPLAYGVSLALHVFLAGAFFHAFCRVSLAVGTVPALVGASAYMLGGVLSGQYGHLNQISAVAWLPLALLAVDQAVARRSVRLAVAAAGVIGLQLLAGHPQQSYMTLVAAAVVCFWRAWPARAAGLSWAVGVLLLAAVLGLALAAVQLVPTAELALASIRGAGLGYRDAVAASLWPWLVARALMPSYVNDLGSTEYLGYIGVVPLLLAVVACGAGPSRRNAFGLSLVGLGLFLAVGGANPLYPFLHATVPGLSSFRVPARWLLLYTVGAASLAALGLDWLLARDGRRLSRTHLARLCATLATVGLAGLAVYLGGARAERGLQLVWLGLALAGAVLALGCARPGLAKVSSLVLAAVVGCELYAAGGDLAPRFPAPVDAYALPRDSTLFVQSRLGADRFLSIASEEYELKETPDYREWHANLSEPALQSFLVAAKRTEVLTPNINLLYRIDDVDGYDGGLLPLQRFLGLSGLLMPAERVRPDGALISRLESTPPGRLMDLLNLRLVLAGRAKDLEQDGVVYDRSVLVSLRPGERLDIARVPTRSYTALGLISSLEGPLPGDGGLVAFLQLTAPDDTLSVAPILAGQHTAATQPAPGVDAPATLELVRPWSYAREGDPVEYLGRVAIAPRIFKRLSLVNSSSAVLHIRSASLIDERDGAFTSLVLDDRLERTTFFDMKVYEYPDVLPRAYLVHSVVEAEDAAGLELLADRDTQPRQVAVIEPGAALDLQPSDGREDAVQVVDSRPERLALRTSSPASALLVLSEAYYPGWKVTVDGQPARLIRTNILFRGVALADGEHEIVFSFEPDSFRLGVVISAVAALVLVSLLLAGPRLRTARGAVEAT